MSTLSAPDPGTTHGSYDFQDLVDAVRADPGIRIAKRSRLQVPDAPHPFIAPRLSRALGAGEPAPFAAEVVVVSSPAAVGKSTAARMLAARNGLPRLDLGRVHVSTDSLSGLLISDVRTPDPLRALHEGR